MNVYGYQLMQQGKKEEALAVFIKNTKTYPQSWNTWDSLAECYGNDGEQEAGDRELPEGAGDGGRPGAEAADRGGDRGAAEDVRT